MVFAVAGFELGTDFPGVPMVMPPWRSASFTDTFTRKP
jgi:hypothetical protein